jgi:hypothetical protein
MSNALNLLAQAQLVEMPTILIGTEVPEEFCCEDLLSTPHRLLNDMIEAQDLIEALCEAERLCIDVPKLSAEVFYYPEENGGFDNMDSIKVTVHSKVSDEFSRLFGSIQNGTHGSDTKVRSRCSEYKNIIFVSAGPDADKYVVSLEDTLKIINSTNS